MSTRSGDRTEVALRHTLEAVRVDADVEVELQDLLGRLAAGSASPPAPIAAPRGRRRVLLPIAAAAAILLAVITAGIVAQQRQDEDRVTTTTPLPAGTGWYVPQGLGDEWTLESVGSDFRDVEPAGSCPCETQVWISPDGEASVVAMTMSGVGGLQADAVFDPDEPVRNEELAPGIEATVGGFLRGDAAVWLQDGERRFLYGIGVSNEEILDAARAVAAAPASDAAPVDGFDALPVAKTPEGIRSFHAVQVVLRHEATGTKVAYVLSPPGYGEDPVTVLVPHRVPVNPTLPWVLAYPPDPEVEMGSDAVKFLGHWPGADVNANGDGGFGEPNPAGSEQEVREVLRSLRPASADEWAAFLDTATGTVDTDPALDVANLDDLTAS